MKKYIIYQLHANYGELQQEFYNYREAFKRYHQVKKPKTLFGFTDDGKINVILSKV